MRAAPCSEPGTVTVDVNDTASAVPRTDLRQLPISAAQRNHRVLEQCMFVVMRAQVCLNAATYLLICIILVTAADVVVSLT